MTLKKIPLFLGALALVFAPMRLTVLAGQDFKANNPDIDKFEFTRSYIAALSHIHAIDARWKENPLPKSVGDDIAIMRGYVVHLIKDNADLRIAKNFLLKYLDSPNPLIRKTADTFLAACLRQITINDREREIWDQWYAVTSNSLDTPVNERAFVKAQGNLALKRKDAGQTIIEATALLCQVLKSEKNADEKGRILALTSKQRDVLLGRLDAFGRDTLAWGMKPGQDYIQASIALIREVLEDSAYTAVDE